MSDILPFKPREQAFYAIQDPLAVEILAVDDHTTTIRFLESGYTAQGTPVVVGETRTVDTLAIIRDSDFA